MAKNKKASKQTVEVEKEAKKPSKKAAPPSKEPTPPPRCPVCSHILPDIGTPVNDPGTGKFLRFDWTVGACDQCERMTKVREFFMSPGGVYKLNGDEVDEVVEMGEEAAGACVFTRRFLKLGDTGEEQMCAVFENPNDGARYAQPVEL